MLFFIKPYILLDYSKLGASVKVIQTEASLDFVSPLVLSTLSGNKVITNVIDKETNEWINHVDLGIWADLMIILYLEEYVKNGRR